MIPVPTNIPWGILGIIAAALALFGFGHRWASNKAARRNQRRKIDMQKSIIKGQGKVVRLSELKRKKVREIEEAYRKSQTGGVAGKQHFADTINRLFKDLFGKTKD